MKAKFSSGSWIVIFVVGVGLLGVWGSWLTYHEQNPTSTAAELVPQPGGTWSVTAEFPPDKADRAVVGTLAVFTSPVFPDLKMAGVIEERMDDGRFRLRVTSGPPADAPANPAPCVVTIDAATIPVDR